MWNLAGLAINRSVLEKLRLFITVLARPLRNAKRGLRDVRAGFVETHSPFALGDWALR